MYRFITFIAVVAVAHAASITEHTEPPKEIIKILHAETINKADGSYDFMYEGADGTIREEGSVIVNQGTEDESADIHGSYKYIDTDGKEVEVHYTAGKNGFVPYGTNIPAEITANAQAAADLPDEDPETESAYTRKTVKKTQTQPQRQSQPQSQRQIQPQRQPQPQPQSESAEQTV